MFREVEGNRGREKDRNRCTREAEMKTDIREKQMDGDKQKD